MGNVDTISVCSSVILIFVYVMIAIQFFEWTMLFMHKNEALRKEKLDRIVYTRRGICIVLELVAIILLVVIKNSA